MNTVWLALLAVLGAWTLVSIALGLLISRWLRLQRWEEKHHQ